MKLKAALKNVVRRNHRSLAAKAVAKLSAQYLRAYYNEHFWDMSENGEARLIGAIASLYPKPRALDVGAHRGEWADAFLTACPQGALICFEVIPEIRAELGARFASDTRVRVAECGLSDVTGDVDVLWNKSFDTTNAISVDPAQYVYRDAIVEKVCCSVFAGDDYLAAHPIGDIDLLKIDTEGHEVSVLLGLEKTLARSSAPKCIQFEYGVTYLPSHRTLRDVYEILEPAGYAIGRMYPNGVAFKEYEIHDDHFRPGNYVAVRSGDALRTLLAF